MLDKKKPQRAGWGRTKTQSGASVQSHFIPVRVGAQVIGQVKGDTFYKSIRGSKHMLKIPPAIAFDIQSLKDAEKAGAVWVVITDLETGKIYRVSIEHIRRAGFRVNRGYGEQVALALSKWHIGGEDVQLPLLA